MPSLSRDTKYVNFKTYFADNLNIHLISIIECLRNKVDRSIRKKQLSCSQN